jgi:Transglycosylase SLT domain
MKSDSVLWLLLFGTGAGIAYYYWRRNRPIGISAPEIGPLSVPILKITTPTEQAAGANPTSTFLQDLLTPNKTTIDILESLTGSAINGTAPGAGFQGAVLGTWLTPDKDDIVHFTSNGAIKSEKAPYSGIQWEPHFIAASSKYGIPAGVLSRLAWQESRYNPTAFSIAGARGMMQIVPKWYPQWTVTDLNDPSKAIYYAAQILQGNFSHYGNWSKAIVAYNQGIGNVDKAVAAASKAGAPANWLNFSPIGPDGRNYNSIAVDTGLA